jgi:hypothetical protein
VRRALLKGLPQLTRFYYGAIHPLNVDEFTTRELAEYSAQMNRALAEEQR